MYSKNVEEIPSWSFMSVDECRYFEQIHFCGSVTTCFLKNLHSISQHAERRTSSLLACLNLPRSNSPKRCHQQCQTLRRLLLGPDSVFITWQHCFVIIEEQSCHRSRCCEFWWTSVQPCWYLCTRVLAGLQPTININVYLVEWKTKGTLRLYFKSQEAEQ